MRRKRFTVTKRDWDISPMPEKTAQFTFFKRFSKQEMESLKMGHYPEEMEDHWFAYFEDNKLYIHRSWSGLCIYIVAFNPLLGLHKVTVNRDDSQYDNTDMAEDKETLRMLLRNMA